VEGGSTTLGSQGTVGVHPTFDSITGEQIEALKEKTHALFILGSFEYRDIFDRVFELKFCHYFGGDYGCPDSGTLANYELGNRVN
jgi:hypothetical protein